MAYIQGAYVADALMATVGNMFAGKTSKKHEYPDKPYVLNTEEQRETEAERQRKLLASQLTLAMHNFNRSKSKEEGQSK